MAGAARVGASAEQRLRGARQFDFWLAASACTLLAAGLASLFSKQYETHAAWFNKQVFNVILGFVPFSIFALVHPTVWMRYARVLYIGNVVLLALVLVIGKHDNGAQRWIPLGPIQFQPSELAKLFVAITLASFFATRQDAIDKFSTFGLSFAHVIVPAILILKQPHVGACLVLLVIWLSICLVANVPFKFVAGAVCATALLFVLAFTVPQVSSLVLRGYHHKRLGAMFKSDEKDSTYQASRAEIAFGAGGVMGEGFLRGEQKQAGFIPEQHNDFVFTIVGEEGGLIGCSIVLAAFAFFFYRIWLIMLRATEPYYRMLAAGVFGMLAFHMVVNICMVLQILPVVGLWLPFLSYGGTAIWLCMAAVGLMLNVRSREKPLLF